MEESRLKEIASRITNEKARSNWLSFMQSVESSDEPCLDDCEFSPQRDNDGDGLTTVFAEDLKDLERQRFERIQEMIQNPFPQEQLIVAPIGINARTKCDQTPLMDAVMEDDIERVKELLMLGADPSIKNNSHHTAADIARRLGYEDILAVLV